MLTVCTTQKSYEIVLSNSFEPLLAHFTKMFSRDSKIFIIIDRNVSYFYNKAITGLLKTEYEFVYSARLEPGESNKSLAAVSAIYEFLLNNNADRNSVVVAFGGGVTGDIAGFAAATYMRGIRLVQVPTTLLSMVDSSVGGKTGVDFSGYKNIIGSFYQPDLVYINTGVLKWLPPREISAGMAEVVKYGLIMDADFFEYIFKNSYDLRNEDFLKAIIEKSVKYKAEIVEKDENEKGLREILNFGHTFGHAIESLKNFSLLHGECVALGMIAALKVSEKRHGFCVSDKYISLLNRLNLPKTVQGLAFEEIREAMRKDKKSKGGNTAFVLLSDVGAAYSAQDVSNEEIAYGINFITEC